LCKNLVSFVQFSYELPLKHESEIYLSRPIVAHINSEALRHNLARVRELVPNSKVWSVIKANAYGHGITKALEGMSGTDGFALLDLSEAKTLRDHGWRGPILLLEGLFTQEDVFEALDLHCDCVVHDLNQVDWLESAIEARQSTDAKGLQIFLKMNTGMNRLGLVPESYREVYHRLHSVGYQVSHMTHFANADYVDRTPSVDQQFELFNQTIEGLAGETSLSNSAAILWHHHVVNSDWVRPGIMLYGASPSGRYEDIEHAKLQAAMSLRSKVISIQHLDAGEAVGYGSRYRTDVPIRIAVVACGYADGYPRHAPDGTPVWVAGASGLASGQICRIAGQVSMDMITIDVTDMPHVDVGTDVELWGDYLPVDQVAQAAGTIGYELLCAIAPRVKRS
jgi:alanine racemase